MYNKMKNNMKKTAKLIISICVVIITIGVAFICVQDTNKSKIQFISDFYKDLTAYSDKDSVIKSNCTNELLCRLNNEYRKEMQAWEDLEDWDDWGSTALSKEHYADWKFYGEGTDFDWVKEVLRVTPLNNEWFQIYVGKNCYLGGKSVVYVKIKGDNGLKIDHLRYDYPYECCESGFSSCTFKEKCKICLISIFKGYTFDKCNVGMISVQKKEKVGRITRYGKELIPCIYNSISPYDGDIFRVRLNGKYGLVDLVGEEIQACIYDEMGAYINNRALVKLNGKYGFIGKGSGTPIKLYDSADNFSCYGRNRDALAKVEVNGKFGYVDIWENEVIPCKYDNISKFSHGLFVVMRNGKFGYVDEFGEEVFGCNFEYADDFREDGTAYVKSNGVSGKIDRYGNFRKIIISSYNSVQTHPRTPLPMKVCDICKGTGQMAIGGGGMVLDRQSCLGCGGSGMVPDSSR